LQTNSEALQLEQRDEQWHALDEQGHSLANAAVAVICSAADSRRFSQSRHLPLMPIRGQITHLPATAQSHLLKTVLCAEGYISPARHGEHHLGASFRFDRLDNQPSTEENIENLQLLDKLSPALTDALQPNTHDTTTLTASASLISL